jgi:hypothetical protein
VPLTDPDALLDMIDAHIGITRRTARDIANAGVDHLEQAIRRRTPIDTNPYRHNPDRPRGSLRASVQRRAGVDFTVRGGREAYRGEVQTFDPIVRYVETDTPAHTIRPRTPGGRLRFQSRHGFVGKDGEFYPPGTWISVEEVEHPGTKGSHMFTLGAWATEREFRVYAAGPIARWKRQIESVHT